MPGHMVQPGHRDNTRPTARRVITFTESLLAFRDRALHTMFAVSVWISSSAATPEALIMKPAPEARNTWFSVRHRSSGQSCSAAKVPAATVFGGSGGVDTPAPMVAGRQFTRKLGNETARRGCLPELYRLTVPPVIAQSGRERFFFMNCG